MSLKSIEEIVGLQGYSVTEMSITPQEVSLQLTKTTASYCCPTCRQTTFAGYDSTVRTIEDLPLGDKRLFLTLPIVRLSCPTCHTVQTEALPFLAPYQRHTKRFLQYIHRLCTIHGDGERRGGVDGLTLDHGAAD